MFTIGTPLELGPNDVLETREYKGLMGVVHPNELTFSVSLEMLAYPERSSGEPEVIEEVGGQLLVMAELMRKFPHSCSFEYDDSVPIVHLRLPPNCGEVKTMTHEQAIVKLRVLVTQELRKLDFTGQPVKFRYWNGDTSLNAMIAVPAVVAFDDEELEFPIMSDKVQAIDTGINVREIIYPESCWLSDGPTENFRNYVVYDYDVSVDGAHPTYHVGENGELTLSVVRLDSLELEECGDVQANPEELKAFILGLESIYGKFDPEVVSTVVEDYASLFEDGELLSDGEDEFTLR